jgi:glycosyltransferase involved in cell wall biosynthesis
MAAALTSVGITVDFIGSDEVASPELIQNRQVRFLNYRDQRSDAGLVAKMLRVMAYYWRLIRYAATTEVKIFHVLWNNKFEFFDRTLVMLYYKALGKKIVFTAHNVNAGKRDSNDSRFNRLSLRIQYALSDHIFVHTKAMKTELLADFGVPEEIVSVIPFGVNNTVANTDVSSVESKRRLGLEPSDKAILFFGNIAPYKGLEYLIAAFIKLAAARDDYRLIIAGRVKGPESYWSDIWEKLDCGGLKDRVIARIEYIPDEETELYFKAADVLVLPYTRIFQSGVLFLAYNFGLPVIAADVGNLNEDIVEGETGFVFKSGDSSDLAVKTEKYFKSELFEELEERRAWIKEYANERFSWSKVATVTRETYLRLLGI